MWLHLKLFYVAPFQLEQREEMFRRVCTTMILKKALICIASGLGWYETKTGSWVLNLDANKSISGWNWNLERIFVKIFWLILFWSLFHCNVGISNPNISILSPSPNFRYNGMRQLTFIRVHIFDAMYSSSVVW